MNTKNGFTLVELMIVIAIIGIIASVVLSTSVGGVGFYGYINSKDVRGHLESVTSAMPSGSIVHSTTNVFQAGVVIKQENGAYVTFSTDDRQWAPFVGDKAAGKCAVATIYPYAPWDIGKAQTFHGGRLLEISDCASAK